MRVVRAGAVGSGEISFHDGIASVLIRDDRPAGFPFGAVLSGRQERQTIVRIVAILDIVQLRGLKVFPVQGEGSLTGHGHVVRVKQEITAAVPQSGQGAFSQRHGGKDDAEHQRSKTDEKLCTIHTIASCTMFCNLGSSSHRTKGHPLFFPSSINFLQNCYRNFLNGSDGGNLSGSFPCSR